MDSHRGASLDPSVIINLVFGLFAVLDGLGEPLLLALAAVVEAGLGESPAESAVVLLSTATGWLFSLFEPFAPGCLVTGFGLGFDLDGGATVSDGDAFALLFAETVLAAALFLWFGGIGLEIWRLLGAPLVGRGLSFSCFSIVFGLVGAFPGNEQQQKREDRKEAIHYYKGTKEKAVRTYLEKAFMGKKVGVFGAERASGLGKGNAASWFGNGVLEMEIKVVCGCAKENLND